MPLTHFNVQWRCQEIRQQYTLLVHCQLSLFLCSSFCGKGTKSWLVPKSRQWRHWSNICEDCIKHLFACDHDLWPDDLKNLISFLPNVVCIYSTFRSNPFSSTVTLKFTEIPEVPLYDLKLLPKLIPQKPLQQYPFTCWVSAPALIEIIPLCTEILHHVKYVLMHRQQPAWRHI